MNSFVKILILCRNYVPCIKSIKVCSYNRIFIVHTDKYDDITFEYLPNNLEWLIFYDKNIMLGPIKNTDLEIDFYVNGFIEEYFIKLYFQKIEGDFKTVII